ncbi:MAG: Ku protein, partial [Actinomycetota bacterium]|nr:Ku protein [Actinomycetota bacterium]
YRIRLQELAVQKVVGEEVTVAQEPEAEPAPVVDIMEALKASVSEAKKRKESESKSTAKKKTTKRRASAS